MIIEFIDAQRRCGHRIFAVCQVLRTLGVVFSDRAYRKARTRPPAARACADAVVVEALLSTRRPDPKTQRPPRERFYGRRKMTHWLRRKGLAVSFCQVDRLMGQERLHGLRRGRVKATTRRDDSYAPASDLVARNFTAAIPDQLWIADMTYVSTWAGWCYTSFVVDVFSQRILGWAIATTMTTQLVQDALAMAVWQRDHHAHPIAGGVVHHSDKGSQGGFQWSSQHLDHGGVLGWDGSRVRRRYRQRRWAVGGSGLRIGRYGRRCVHRGGRSPRVLCSVRSGV